MENVITVDFGPDVEASLDVVGETVIVVAGDNRWERRPRTPLSNDVVRKR
ncbi:hypothetical protein [Haladaptatus salinisoli]|nr:hypothetical protein [Haladaptatus salinisoli]